MGTVRRTNQEVRAGKGKVDAAKMRAATPADIVRWAKDNDVDMSEASLAEARYVPAVTDVRKLREQLGLSQGAFAERYMLSARTVQEWEQHRREPADAARVLLFAISNNPAAVARALRPKTKASQDLTMKPAHFAAKPNRPTAAKPIRKYKDNP
jgi:DNA-binding transcriptional regulator YiaG